MKSIKIAAPILIIIILIAAFFIARQPSASDLLKKGESEYKKGNIKSAISVLEKSLKKDNKPFKTNYLLAKAHESQGNINESIKYMKISSGKEPKNSEVHYNLAILYKADKQLDKAIIKLQEALAVDRAFIGAKLVLAKTYFENKNYDESIQAYNELLLSSSPVDKEQLKVELAIVYLSISKPTDAKKLINEVLKKDPENSEALKVQKKLGN